jgi:AraC-like DNA-binding protein
MSCVSPASPATLPEDLAFDGAPPIDLALIDAVASTGMLAGGQLLVWERCSRVTHIDKLPTRWGLIGLVLETVDIELAEGAQHCLQRLRVGDVVVVPPATQLRLHSGDTMRMFYVMFGPGMLQPLPGRELRHGRLRDPTLRSILDTMHELLGGFTAASAPVMELLSQAVLSRALEATARVVEMQPAGGLRERHLSHAEIEAIDAGLLQLLQTRCPVAELARRMGVTPEYLSRLYKLSTGQSLRGRHLNLRLDRALELLAGRQMSVTEVALETGFGALPHFSRVFARRFGRPPSNVLRDMRLSALGMPPPLHDPDDDEDPDEAGDAAAPAVLVRRKDGPVSRW